ncbi:MAG: hypothetical protein IKR34_01495, partial [Candidatus Gastranaerophilales bacterium]|nr:hypothetical protein [Candidatus Gastranaerophilales bacterium]
TLAGTEKDRTLEFTYYKKHPKSVSYKKRKIKSASKVQKMSKRELKKLENPKPKKVKKQKVQKEKKVKTKKSWNIFKRNKTVAPEGT